MKLQNNNKKKKIITIVVISIVAALLIGGIVALMLIDNIKELTGYTGGNEDGLTGIIISSLCNTTYYLNEEFDPEGLQIQVLATDNSKSYFVDHTNPELKISGFDSSTVGEKTITVSYREFSDTFTVKIKEKPQPPVSNKVLESIRLSDNFNTTYNKTDWNFFGPTLDDVKLICTFSDGSEESVPMLYNYIQNPNLNIQSACTYDLIIKYSYANTTVTTTVTITITN